MDLNHTPEKFINGKLLLINKPINWTSFQVVNKIRWALTNFFGLKALKVGHCGTLDPLATGLMLICTGKMTKKINDYTSLDKSYNGKIRLGATTQSYDLETTPENFKGFNHITLNEIEKAKKKFLGTVLQKPPIYSAIKKNGKRLYQYARSGEKIEIESRKVKINSFEINDVKLPDLSFLILHGNNDKIVPVIKSVELKEILEKSGHDVSLVTYNAGHTLPVSYFNQIRIFLDK